MLSIFGSDSYPLPKFHFKVLFAFSLGLADTAFQSVSGLKSKITLDSIAEGGENERVHYVPKEVTHDNLVLKRGISTWDSPLFVWMESIFHSNFSERIIPQPLQIHLLDGDGLPKRVWQINDALPVSWTIDDFDSTKNEVAIESIELKYATCTRVL